MIRLICNVAISALLLTCISCKKDEQSPTFYYSALVVDRGPIETDGCGWHVIVYYDFGQTDYIPTNLPEAFKSDSLPVTVSFTIPGDSIACGFSFVKFPSMSIDSIK